MLRFQTLAGLKEDGELGPKTLRAMTRPRCSCPDFYLQGGQLLMEVLSAKWGRRNLTYFIRKRDSDLDPDVWDAIIEQGFAQWSDVANLNITRTTKSSGTNFIMSVGSGRGDGFDGPQGTLAWAQLPPNNNYNGQLLCRFDSAETWVTLDKQHGIKLLNVATHEIGHLLGLGHSSVDTALMAPFYSPSISKPVQDDDVTRIIGLYGRATGTTPPPPTDNDPAAPSNLVAERHGDTSVKLSWDDNSTGEDRFEIFRNNIKQGSVGRGWTYAIDEQVPVGTYEYHVRAIKDGMMSKWSNVAVITLGDVDTPPTPPKDEELTIKVTGQVNGISIPGYRVTKIG